MSGYHNRMSNNWQRLYCIHIQYTYRIKHVYVVLPYFTKYVIYLTPNMPPWRLDITRDSTCPCLFFQSCGPCMRTRNRRPSFGPVWPVHSRASRHPAVGGMARQEFPALGGRRLQSERSEPRCVVTPY